MRQWGDGIGTVNYATNDFEKDERVQLLREAKGGVGSSLWDAIIYVKDEIPENILLIGSKDKIFSRVELTFNE